MRPYRRFRVSWEGGVVGVASCALGYVVWHRPVVDWLAGMGWGRGRQWQWGQGRDGGWRGVSNDRLQRWLSFSWDTLLFWGGRGGTERWDKRLIARAPIGGALARRGGAGGLRVVRRRCTSPSFFEIFITCVYPPRSPLDDLPRATKGRIRYTSPSAATSRMVSSVWAWARALDASLRPPAAGSSCQPAGCTSAMPQPAQPKRPNTNPSRRDSFLTRPRRQRPQRPPPHRRAISHPCPRSAAADGWSASGLAWMVTRSRRMGVWGRSSASTGTASIATSVSLP